MSYLTSNTVSVSSTSRRMCRGLFGLGWLAGAVLAFAVPMSAQAGSGYPSVNLNLRAGPSIDYPVVRLAPRGTSVNVYGCIDDYGWCDVSWGGNRGWVSGQYLDYDYYDRRVPVVDYGPRLGLGLISFSFGSYWNNHYRHQSWYGQRDHYSRVVIRHGSPRHHGNYSTRNRASYRQDRHDRRYDRRNDGQHRYQRNERHHDYRRDARNDVRHDRRNIRHDARNNVRDDRRNVRKEVRQNRRDVRDVRNHARNDRREIRRNARSDNRQVRNGRQDVRRDVRTQNRQLRNDRKQATRVARNDRRHASNNSHKNNSGRNAPSSERQR